MHQHRRRKKRPSYGVRTVEISRGKNGFGFTISGQAPCILSCIITGSPAEKAGLRPGDFLIAVNGQNVSKAPHDDVVRLIGNSSGILKLQIAENYYSDSSEEEFISIVKLRPKYPNKIRNRNLNSVSRAEKVVQDLQTGALFVDHIHGNNVLTVPQKTSKSPVNGLAGPSRTNKVLLDLILQQRLLDANMYSMHNVPSQQNKCIASVSSHEKIKQSSKKKGSEVSKSHSQPEHLNTSSSSTSEMIHSIFTEQDLNNILYPVMFSSEQKGINQEQAVLKAVVGYLGTIEMPKEPQVYIPNSRLQTIRNCIRRLRIEKKVHTLVLMSVFTECIVLINPQGITLAEFSADKITFSGVYSDDKKFFGLVYHGRSGDEFSESNQEEQGPIGSSCHVFMVDPKLCPHHQHLKRAKAFHITCTSDPVTNKCKEFPESAESILQAVVGLYRSKLGLNNEIVNGLEFHLNMSPQPSNTSSNSSNSDSGIGFRDEGNASDRVFVVDVDYHQYSTNSLDRQAFSNPGFGLLESPLRSFSLQDSPLIISKTHSQSNELYLSSKNNKSSPCSFDRLTVRAMPDPVGFERNCSYATDIYSLEQSSSTNPRNSLHNLIQTREEFTGQFTNQLTEDNLADNSQSEKSHTNKLSPKVFALDYPLKSAEGDEMGFCNTSVESAGWECTSCSTEELQVHSRHLMLQERDAEDEDGSQDVHPPTQEEDSEFELSGVENESESTHKKLGRTSSLRRHLGRKKSLHRSTHEAGTVSDGELASGKVSTSSSMLALDRMSDTASHRSSCISERSVDVGRVGSWAAGFKILLEDPAGLHTFSEFLKKEFSQENITFWISCENYRQLRDQFAMAQMAKEIYNKHLCIGAHEPVNVDSHARQVAQEGLESPTSDLFLAAQKQIFNLMKFDCYQRFLKSTMFKECMLREMKGEPLLYQGQANGIKSFESDKQKAFFCAELKKRKSLIPWHKLSKTKSNDTKINRSRLWDRHGEIRKSLKKKKKDKDPLKLDDTSSTQSDMTDSRSSLNSSEHRMGQAFKNMSSRESLNSAELTLFPSHCGSDVYYCRVILPDLSTTVVRTQKGETVGEMLLKLLERRSLTYNAVEAYIVGTNQPLDHCTDVTSLSCKEIRVEEVILFCVELPNRKTIGVKAKNNKICGDILKPVLHKYGYKIDCVTMTVASLQKPVVKSAPVTAIDNERIIVEIKHSFPPDAYSANKNNKLPEKKLKSTRSFPDLEELTNQIFDDLLKTRPEFQYDGLCGIDYERKNMLMHSSKSTSQQFHGNIQKDTDTLPSKSKSNSKTEVIKMLGENKPLLPYNLHRTKCSCHGVIDTPCLPCMKDSHTSEGKFEISSNDISHGKENCPLSKAERKSFSSIDDYGLSTAFQNMDTNFNSDIYFQRACYTSNDYEESGSEKFLQNLGIIPSDVNLKQRHTQWTSANVPPIPPPPPRLPPRLRPSEQSDAGFELGSTSASNLDSTLIANDSFELDLDIDVTLHAQSDESISPKVSFLQESSNQVEDLPIEKEVPFPQPLLRRLLCEPPPVPPKTLARGPPPRPPSRQRAHSNPAFCLTSEDDLSENELENNTKSDLNIVQQKNNYLNLSREYEDYNISFV